MSQINISGHHQKSKIITKVREIAKTHKEKQKRKIKQYHQFTAKVVCYVFVVRTTPRNSLWLDEFTQVLYWLSVLLLKS